MKIDKHTKFVFMTTVGERFQPTTFSNKATSIGVYAIYACRNSHSNVFSSFLIQLFSMLPRIIADHTDAVRHARHKALFIQWHTMTIMIYIGSTEG